MNDPSASVAFTAADDAGPAKWAIAAVRDFDYTVGSVVPASFECYGRVFHPARRDADDQEDARADRQEVVAVGQRAIWEQGKLVRWSEVASANDRRMHPAAEWGSLIGSWQLNKQPGLWDTEPLLGAIPESVAVGLASVLARHTRTALSCWFGVWAGKGSLRSELQHAARFEMPQREMLLLHGPVYAAASSPYPDPGPWDSVNIWWPEDRSWCVGTDIDLMTTYVGAGAECIRDLLAERSLEVLTVTLDQLVTWDADTINPLPAPP